MSLKLEQAFIQDFVNANFGLPIAHENVIFKPVQGQAYAELLTHPNDTTPYTLSDSNQTDGVLKVILSYPLGVGGITPKQKAQAIVNHFFIGKILTYDNASLTITKTNQRVSNTEDAWFKLIIEFTYRAIIRRF